RAAAAVAALAFADKLRAPDQAAGGDVEDRHVAEHVIERLVGGDVLRGLADHEGKLGLGLIDHAGGNVAQLDRFAGADQVGRLVKILVGKIVRRASGPVDVVAEGGEKLAGPRERRMNFHTRHRHAALLGQNLLEAAAIL